MRSGLRLLLPRLSIKLLVIFELVLLIAICALLIAVKSKMREQIVVDMQNELRGIAGTAALQLDGDLLSAAQVEGPNQADAIARTRKVLEEIRIRNTLRPDNVYTFNRDAEGNIFRGVGPANSTRQRADARSEMIPVFDVGVVTTTDLFNDPAAGETISAYAPIRNRAGQIVSILEVNHQADEYFSRYRLLIIYFIIMGLIALLISSIVGWIVLNVLVINPIAKLKTAMLALARQDFRHRVKIHTHDEFEELGTTLNKMSQQLNIARAVQSSFIPKTLPNQSGYRIAAATEPCDATAGDYFDAFALDENRIAVLVADVTGHGLGPSLLMSACRSSLRALSTADLTPQQIIKRLDELLRHDLTDGRFITMIFGVLDANGTFTYTNAGHGPAMLAAEGRCRSLPPHRPPLGVELVHGVGDALQTTTQLSPGDRLLLYSDGVSEAMNDNHEQFGVARIERIVCNTSLDPDQVVQRILEAMHAHCGGPTMQDDVTILCVDRLG
jgi:serine phosphatase RsbU (regulator of sigma subunit)